jgi:phytanoyl-CoA hydroxylase
MARRRAPEAGQPARSPVINVNWILKMSLTQKQLDHYVNDGHLLVPSLLDRRSLDALILDLDQRVTRVATELHKDGRLPSLFSNEAFDRRLVKLHQSASDAQTKKRLWQAVEVKFFDLESEALFGVMTHPAVLDVVEQLVGPEIRFHPQSNLRAKLPGHQEGMVPWHQDSVGLSPDSEKTLMVNFWIPLVDVSMDMGGMQVMRGPHHRGNELNPDGFAIPDAKLPTDEIVDCPVPLGGALMIQKRTIHRSVPNTSQKVRWSLDFRYCSADQPAGRPGGFIARSRRAPQRAITSFDDYKRMLPELRTIWTG